MATLQDGREVERESRKGDSHVEQDPSTGVWPNL